jgi:hypothetical protein
MPTAEHIALKVTVMEYKKNYMVKIGKVIPVTGRGGP